MKFLIKSKLLLIKQKIFPELFNSNDMVSLLRMRGIKVGNGTIFYHPGRSAIDTSRPCLLEIGEYCKITSGVIILTHDYSRSVLRRKYGEIIGEGKKTIIGDNVFIGMNSIILMGSQIGSNVIIGAGSVVSGKIPDNVVVAGNPAKVVRTLEEHYEIRKKKSCDEAIQFALTFKKANGRWPTIKEMDPFFGLFLERDRNALIKNNLTTKLGGDDEEDVIKCFLQVFTLRDHFFAMRSFVIVFFHSVGVHRTKHGNLSL